jgi:hypothetical protein
MIFRIRESIIQDSQKKRVSAKQTVNQSRRINLFEFRRHHPIIFHSLVCLYTNPAYYIIYAAQSAT